MHLNVIFGMFGRQWVTQSVIRNTFQLGHSKLDLFAATIFPDPFDLMEVECTCSLFQTLVVFLASPPIFAKFTLLMFSCRVCRDGTRRSFMTKVILNGCCMNYPFLLILKEQFTHLWSVWSHLGLTNIRSLNMAQIWF